MCPCDPLDITLNPDQGPSGPSIPGFGKPFTINPPSGLLDGFPEDLLEIFNSLNFILPPGILQPNLNPNFGKDVFDGIMKLLDSFMPFLMLYKFFIPILNIIICIMEVLCASMNPFKMARAIRRLFRNCIPAFINLFPIFALIIMIISILILLLALIQYIIEQIIKFIELILRNILALEKAIEDGDAGSILAIAAKIGSLLCMFQNLFVLLSLFTSIVQVIRDMLSLANSIPPCDNSSADDPDGCCTPDVCPAIVKSDYNRSTGTLRYLRGITVNSGLTLPSWFGSFGLAVREEGWFIYDADQELLQEFRNIIDAADIPESYGEKPNFFPTDGVYNETSSLKLVPYSVDVKVFYNPSQWGRVSDGYARYIEFKDCVVIAPPKYSVYTADGNTTSVDEGVLQLVGGKGYDWDGSVLLGYAADGITPITNQATLNNFLHIENRQATDPDLFATDGYQFNNIEYTFKPNFEYLVKKQLVTLGCDPDIDFDKSTINTMFTGDLAVITQTVNDILNNSFPDTAQAQLDLSAAVDALRADVSVKGVSQFSDTTGVILDKLKVDAENALSDLFDVGVSPCDSILKLSDKVQFTTKTIDVTVTLNERNGIPLSTGMPKSVLDEIAKKLKGHITFGNITKFSPDGTNFKATLSSNKPGKGVIMVSFDGAMLCTNNIPSDLDIPPSIDIQEIEYEFIETSFRGAAEVTDDGKPRRDDGDVARDGVSS